MVGVPKSLTSNLLAVGLLLGCSTTPTEIVVLVDTNIADQLSGIQLFVSAPNGETSSSTAVVSTTDLPVSQSHVLQGDDLGPYRFEAAGFAGDQPIISLTKTANFVSGERRTLRLNLDRSCAFVTCEQEDATCSDGSCGAVELATLEDYSGKTRFYGGGEGGVSDGGLPDRDIPDATEPETCVPQTEVCDNTDNDCDNSVDEGSDLTSDPDNCGACGAVCRPNAGLGIESATCGAAGCTFACAPNFDDCDGDVSDGCEDITTKQRCGSCNNSCRGNRTCTLVDASYQCLN